MASPGLTREQFESAGARVLRITYLHSFFTLIVDEALGFLRARRPTPVAPAGGQTSPGAGAGTAEDRVYGLLRVLEPFLDVLEWPWKLFGLSNGFFVLVEKL